MLIKSNFFGLMYFATIIKSLILVIKYIAECPNFDQLETYSNFNGKIFVSVKIQRLYKEVKEIILSTHAMKQNFRFTPKCLLFVKKKVISF